MTAAAVRPDLFNHLFATQRSQPDQRDLAASTLSVVLHGSAVAALIWASTALAPDTPDAAEPMPIPIVFAAPEVAIEAAVPGAAITAPGRAISMPDPADQPVIDPRLPIPDAGTEPWIPPGYAPVTRAGPPNPPGSVGDNTETRGGFVVSKVPPQLLNAPEVQRALERNYPALLRDAGIGGRVVLWLLVDETGRVIETDVREGSGQSAFDSAAARVGEIMRFSPGKNREDRVKVWVSLPVVFRTR
jgi:protein TonB